MKLCRSFPHTVAALLQMQSFVGEISTGHCFPEQQQKDYVFTGSRSRAACYFQREIGLWASRSRVRKQGTARKTRSGTDGIFFLFLLRIIRHSHKNMKHLFPSWS